MLAKSAIDNILQVIPVGESVGVVVSFGRFLPQRLLRAMKSVINVHPSLLPRWRGASPLMHTLLTGDRVSGVTIIQLKAGDASFDSGLVLLQRPITLPSHLYSVTELANFLTPLCADALIEVGFLV